MKHSFLRWATKLNSDAKRRRGWRRAVRIMTMIVVFCTTYALILPAITWEEAPVCGLEEHIHGPDCYEAVEAEVFLCQNDGMSHIHGELCFGPDGALLCPWEETDVHIHTEDCETTAYQLICQEEHDHEDGCFLAQTVRICKQEELPFHEHSTDCFGVEEQMLLICPLTEHTHTELCYPVEEDPWQSDYICGLGEHHHVASCFDGDTLICTVPDHSHDDSCLEAPVKTTLTHTGTDYEVLVTYDGSAGLPADVTLSVMEILPHTEAYEAYLNEAAAAVQEDIAFARFFDITFLHDGREVEPETPVCVEIRYDTPVQAEGDGVAVHFAEDGIEVLPTQTEGTEAFSFTQSSFSVSGTLITASQAASGTAVKIDFSQVDTTGGTEYLIYAQYNGRLYALTANSGDVTGYSRVLTDNGDGTVTYSDDTNLFWTFTQSGSACYVQNTGSARYLHAFDNSTATRTDYGTTTGGRNASTLTETGTGFIARGNNYYTGLYDNWGNITFNRISGSGSAVTLYVAEKPRDAYYVWLDGTHDGIMAFSGSDDTCYAMAPDSSFTLPTQWKSPSQYDYRLKGWYEVHSGQYYKPGDTVTVTQDMVFYADWVAATYDVGQDNLDVVQTMDTSEFVTIEMFDYNALFNTQSAAATGSVTSSSHTETWSQTEDGLGFMFRDWDSYGRHITYAANLSDINNNHTAVTSGIVGSPGDPEPELIDILFDPDREVIGKEYLGTGNYLFQYMDDPTSEHDGYYYYDSSLNAASYNQSRRRFYVYDYTERTVDSPADSPDFLPLNSPYANTAGFEVGVNENGIYTYEAKNRGGANITNYHSGMKTTIHFYLPNEAGVPVDDYGNLGNLDTNGNPMIFHFRGDDDLWVYVDGKLLLDVGGIHGVRDGSINFSTGEVIVDGEVVHTFEMDEGGHDMAIYYLERGSSQSNCAIYFNLAPRYGLQLEKLEYLTRDAIDGIVFSVYTDEACTEPAVLWNTHAEAKVDAPSTNHFTVTNGRVQMWGLVAGKNYYLVEDKALTPAHVQEQYVLSDDVLRVSLNDHGVDISELTILRGPDGIRDDGFEVIRHGLDEETQTVDLALTNPRYIAEESKRVKVFKKWNASDSAIPDSITVHLTANGQRYGPEAELTAAEGWVHSWTGLPVHDETGGEIEYGVEEIHVPGYAPNIAQRQATEQTVDWLQVAVLEDGGTYLLLVDGQAVANRSGVLRAMDPAAAQDDPDAHWYVEAWNDGFRLSCGEYHLTLQNGSWYMATVDSGNQTLYYDGAGLFGMYANQRYYFGSLSGGQAAASSQNYPLQLIKQEVTETDVLQFVITNTPLNEDEMTALTVNKVWVTDRDTSNMEVTIRLVEDGRDTGRTVTLNAKNNWTATFDGLEIGPQWSVREVRIPGYSETYSEITQVTESTYLWSENATFASGNTYCFVYNGRALADNNGALTTTTVDMDNVAAAQQWEAVTYNNALRLRNVGTGRYIRISSSTLSLNSSQSRASVVTVSNGRLNIGGSRYLAVNASGAVSAVRSSGSGAAFTFYSPMEQHIPAGWTVTVTNTYNGLVLPQTGGTGTFPYEVSGLLILAAALLYITYPKFRRKPAKGGG